MSDEKDSVLEAITMYAVADTATGDAYKKLFDEAKSYSWTRDDFAARLLISEHEFMEENYSDTEAAKTKSGKWKYRSYLPAAYSSAKSVILTAIERGTIPVGSADHIGKTELQRRNAAATPTSKNDLVRVVEAFLKQHKGLIEVSSASDRVTALTKIKEAFK